MPVSLDYYAILGIFRDASKEEIKRAYLEAAQRLHPDKNEAPGETELFLDIQQAYEVLSDSERRIKYDASLPTKEEVLPPVVDRVLYSRQSLVHINETQLMYALLEWKPRESEGEVSSPPQIEREEGQGDDLAREGLGRRHADFRAGMKIHSEVGFPGDGGAHRVHDAHGRGAATFGLPECGKGVRSFPGLAYGHNQRRLVHQGTLVSKLGGVFHLHRNPGKLLQHVLPQECRMPGGSTSRDDDPLDAKEFQIR